MAVNTKDGAYSRAIFVKRKRVDEPMDALLIDLPSQSKRYRGSMAGSVDGRGMFTLAETMTEDPSLLDDLRTKDLHKRLAMINQESRASPKVASPASAPMSPTALHRPPVGSTREFKVLRAARASSSVSLPTVAATPDPDAAASAPAPRAVPIAVPGQPSASVTATATASTTDTNEPGFVLYEAVPAEVAEVEDEVEVGSVSATEMDEFQDLLTEYLRVNEISLDAPPPRKPVTSSAHAHAAAKKPAEEEEEEYVWDVFYQRANLSGDLSVWDGLANVGTLSGLPLADGDILADEEDSDSVKDEADEDSNEEDFYRNDYPDTESEESEAYESDGDHEWR
ncbi:hypothetical protein BDV93DRAFT_517968 [Ceratobasidium sp. AG-I]|nr:hypothetical protein BDV93DRAFT_517968 [Ceratobasidium sp. AG-I]